MRSCGKIWLLLPPYKKPGVAGFVGISRFPVDEGEDRILRAAAIFLRRYNESAK